MSEHPPRQRPDVSVRAVGEEVLVLDRAASRIHQLNVTASFIWTRCDGRHTPAEIASALAGAFDVDPATARDAVGGSLGQLAALGLLEPGPA
jgi:hypothetical protein